MRVRHKRQRKRPDRWAAPDPIEDVLVDIPAILFPGAEDPPDRP